MKALAAPGYGPLENLAIIDAPVPTFACASSRRR